MEKISSFGLLFPSFVVPLKYDSHTLLAVVVRSQGASSVFVSCSPHSLHSADLVSSYSSFSWNSSLRTKDMLTAVLGASSHYCYCLDMQFKQETNKFWNLQHKRRLSGKKATSSRFKSLFTLFVLRFALLICSHYFPVRLRQIQNICI